MGNQDDIGELVNRDADAAQRIQEKTHFYFITLSFTLLALGISTYEPMPGHRFLSLFFEILSWVALMLSGLIGLYRMYQMPTLYKLSIRILSISHDISKAESESEGRDPEKVEIRISSGEMVNAKDYIERKREQKRCFEGRDESENSKNSILLKANILFLMLGIMILAIARSYAPITDAISYLNRC